MSQDIINEVMFLIHSFFMGVIITVAYDGFLILRKLIKHTMLLISLEDMLFWIACAISVFYMLNEENNGILRWFAVAGAALGMIIYKKSLSPVIIGILSNVLAWIFHFLFQVLGLLLKPLVFAEKKLHVMLHFSGRKLRKVIKYLKNKLTAGLKLLKMTLSKH